MNLSDQLADDFVPRVIDLLRFSESERVEIVILLQRMARELAEKIQDAEIAGRPDSQNLRRLAALKTQADATIRDYYTRIQRVAGTASRDIVTWSADKAVEGINKAVGVEIASVRLTTETVRAIVNGSLINGHPASSWWAKQSTDLQRNFYGQMQMGMLAGETNDQLVRRVIGRATPRILRSGTTQLREYEGGIMQTTRREAMALVRTSAMAMSSNANMQTFEQNKDVLRGIQAVVTLDLRTTFLCMSRSGAAWDFEGKPLPESRVKIPYPGPTPWHWNCRTVLVPIVKSFQQLLEEVGTKLRRKLSGLDDATQASMDGQVAAEWNYQDWLSRQSEARQNQVLGPVRAELFRKGKLSLSQLVDPTGRALTLEQLRSSR